MYFSIMIRGTEQSSENGPFITREAYEELVNQHQNLVGQNQDLVGQNQGLEKDNTVLREQLAVLNHQYDQLRRMVYGKKSERFIAPPPEQLCLDLGVEPGQTSGEEQTEEVTYRRKKPEKKHHAIRMPLPAHLPRKDQTIEPDNIPAGAKKIGEAVTEILEYKPALIYVKRFIRPKYALPKDEGVIIGELPMLPIPKGNAGPGILCYLIISKFIDHLPFYRQRQQLKRLGVDISRVYH